jgi:aminoglycoside phosphotransferase (APT) family kinase protein
MRIPKLHADEVDLDTDRVGRMIARRFPLWAGLPLEPVPSPGTDNVMLRLGHDLVVRLPRHPGALPGLETERRWLPRVAPALPVDVPVPLAEGEPDEGYPYPWTVCRWLPGTNPEPASGSRECAVELAEFLRALRSVPVPVLAPDDASPPRPYRGGPLGARRTDTLTAIDACAGLLDIGVVRAVWDEVARVPEGTGPSVWLHSDLQPGNLLVRDGRLTGVLDFGGLGVGDGAADLAPAWSVLRPEARGAFRAALGEDEATWARGRAWALSIALVALPYYVESNPALAAVSRRTIHAVVEEVTGRPTLTP